MASNSISQYNVGAIDLSVVLITSGDVISLTLAVTKSPSGILGKSVDLVCIYALQTNKGFTDVVTSITWQKKQGDTYQSDDNIALLWPPTMNLNASFTNTDPGNNLRNRAELTNPTSNSLSAVLRINKLRSSDESEYRCVISYVGSSGQTSTSDITKMVVEGSESVRCLSCVDRVQPRHCHYIDNCRQGELCMTEKFVTLTGQTLFNVGCKAKSSCIKYLFDPSNSNTHAQRFLTVDGRVSSLLCRECCNGNMCNANGCGESGFPSLRGPMCFNCQQTSDPTNCDVISVCDQNEKCLIESETEFGDVLYMTKCLQKELCESTGTSIIGKRAVQDSKHCRSCCSTDLCNNQCMGGSTFPTSTVHPTTVPGTTTHLSTMVASTSSPKQSSNHGGTEFLVMFLANYNWAEKVVLLVTSMESSTSITITSPFPNVTRTIALHNHSAEISLPKLLPAFETRKESKGVLISSTNVISIYGFNYFKCCAVEGFSVFPTDKLGTFYKIVSYHPNGGSLIGITALHSDTKVVIRLNTTNTLQYNGVTHHSGDSLNVTLGKLQTFQVKHNSDLTGTTVESTKAVAVLSGNKCANVKPNSCSHLVEYLPPVSKWGRKFIVPPIKSANKMILRVIPSKPNTNISITGESNILTSDTIERSVDALTTYAVSCDNQCLIVQYLHGNDLYTKAFMSLVPAFEQFSNNYVITIPYRYLNFSLNYACIIIKSESLAGLRYNNEELYHVNHSVDSIAFNGKMWSVITVVVSQGDHKITHISPYVHFGVIQYGMSHSAAYGYPVALNLN